MTDWGAPSAVSIAAAALNLLIGLILSLLVAWYYEQYGQSLANRRKFAALLPVLTLTTALVITIVKSSLALSLGLVGALSIVRFRTAIKEPEELIFLFIAIAIGLGVGAEQRWLTLVGVALLLGYMAVRTWVTRHPRASSLYLNLFIAERETSQLSQVDACLAQYAEVFDFRRLDSRDEVLQLTYLVNCADSATLSQLVDALKQRFSVIEISFLQPEQG